MKYALTFGALGATCGAYAFFTDAWLWRVSLLWLAVAFGGVAAAYGGLGGRVFLKRGDGRLSVWSYALFWPVLLLNALTMRIYRRVRGNAHWHEVAPNIYLGGYPNRRDATQLRALGIVSILDAPSEWSAVKVLRGVQYINIPVLDNAAPTPAQLREGTEWIAQQVAHGPIYVHCAMGHGRSALFVAAHLMLSKQAATPDESIAKLQQVRSGVRINAVQQAALNEFATTIKM